MGKDPYHDLDNFTEDEFDFDDLDNMDSEFDGLSMDGFEEIDSDSDRSPVSESRLNTRALRGIAAAAAGGASAMLTRKINSEFPETKNLVDEGLNIATDVVRLKEEFMRDITPTVNQLKTVGRRILPRIEDAIPKTIYDKLNRALEVTDHGGKDPKQGETNDVVLANTIKEVFSAEQTLDRYRTKDAKLDSLINRQLQSSQHRELATMMNDVRTFTMHQTAFNRQISVPYMKKMLELKYQHLWASRDILEVLKLMAQTQEKKLDEIRHNTSLPDIQKEKLTEKYKDMMRDKMLGGITQYVSDFGANVLSNLKTEVLGPTKDMADMLADISEGVAMGLEMDDEMAEMEGRKPQSLMGTAGMHAASYIGGMGGGAVGEELRKMLAPYKGNIELTAGNTKLNAILAMDKIKRGEMDLPGGDLLASLMESALPSLDRTAGSVKNSLFANPDEAMQFDVATRSAIVEIIPGYLAKILQQITELNTGSPASEMVYDARSRTFITDKEYQQSVSDQLFGNQQERTIAMRQGISPLRAGLEKKGHADKVSSFDDVADELGLVFHNLATLKDFPIVQVEEFRNAYEEQNTEYSGYISSALRGCSNPLLVLEMIYLSLFDENGELDRNTYLRWTREIQQYMTGKMEQYKTDIGKHVNSFGNMRHLSNIMSGPSATGDELMVGEDQIKKLMTDIDTKLIRDPEESKRIIDELNEQARAQREEDTTLWSRYQKRKQASVLDESLPTEDTSLTGGTSSNKFIGQISSEITKRVPTKEDLTAMKTTIEDTATKKASAAIEKATQTSNDTLVRIEAAIKDANLPSKLKTAKDKSVDVKTQVDEQLKAFDLKQKMEVGKAKATTQLDTMKEAIASKTQNIKDQVQQARTEVIPLPEKDKVIADVESAAKPPVKETLPSIRQEVLPAQPKAMKSPSLFGGSKIADMIYDVTGTSVSKDYDAQQVDILRTIASNTSAILQIMQDPSFNKGKEGIIGKVVKAPFRAAAWGIKMPFKVAGAALGAVGSTGRFLFGGKKDASSGETVYMDVFRKDEIHTEPLITVRDLKKGLIFKDGSSVRNVHEINQEVYDPYRMTDGSPRDPLKQSAEMPMLVITETDIQQGLVDAKNNLLSKPGMKMKSEPGILRKTAGLGISAIKAVGGLYVKALKGIVSTTVDVARRQFAPFTDVYTKDANENLILVARKRTIEAFGVYADGKQVKSVYDITEPVWNAESGEIMIGEDDIRMGLYDPQGRPLRRFGILVGNVINKTVRFGVAVGLGAAKLAVKGAQILASAAVKLGKKLIEAKNPYIDVFVKGEMDPGKPALSGEGIKFGDYCYANGKLVTSAYGIKEPVYLVSDPDGERSIGNCVVSSEDLKKGLVDIHGTVLTAWQGRSIAGKIITGISNTVVGAGKAAIALGKGILTTGANMVGGLFGGGGGMGGREALKEFVGDKLDVIIAILSQRLQKPGPGYVSNYSFGSASTAEKQAIKSGHILTGRVAAASSSVVAAEMAANKRKLEEDTKIRARIEAKERERERRGLRKRGEDLTGSPTRDNTEKGFLSKIFGTIWDVGKTLAGISVMFFGLTKTWNKTKNLVTNVGGRVAATETAQAATRAVRSTATGARVMDAAGEGIRRGTGVVDNAAAKIQGSTGYKVWQGFNRANRFAKMATAGLAAGAGIFGYLNASDKAKEGKTVEAGEEMGDGAGTGLGLLFGGKVGAKLGGALGPIGKFIGGISGSLFGYKAGGAVGREVGGRLGGTYESYGKGYSSTGKSAAAWTLFNLRCEAYGVTADPKNESIIDEMEVVAMQTISENRPIADEVLIKWMDAFGCNDKDNPAEAMKYFRRYWTERFMPVFIIYSKALDMLGTRMDRVGEDLGDEQLKELFDLVQSNINNSPHLAKLKWLVPTREGFRTYTNGTKVGLMSDKDVDPAYAEELKKNGIEDTRSYIDPRIKAGLGIGAVVAGGTSIGRSVTMQAARGAASVMNKSTVGSLAVKGISATSDVAVAGAKAAGGLTGKAGKMAWDAVSDTAASGYRAEMKAMKKGGQGMGARLATSMGGGNALRTISKFKGGGMFGGVIDAGFAAYDIHGALKEGDTTKATEIGVKALGTIGGGMAGTMAGAAIGTAIFPVVGTAIGGFLGYLLGSSVGESMMDPIAKRIGAWVSDESGPGIFGKRRYNWGLFKYRCKLYGITDPAKFEKTIETLERQSIETIKKEGAKGTLVTDAQALSWAERFGINTKSDAKKAAKYWLMWYKQRFLPTFLGLMGALKGVKMLYDDMDDMEAEVAVAIITEMDKQVKPIIDQVSALTPDQTGYEQWYKARVVDGGMKYDPRSQAALAAQAKVEENNRNKTDTSKNLQADKSDLDTMMALSEKNNRSEADKRKADAAAVTTPQVMENADAAKDALRTKDLEMGDAAAMVAASGLKTSIEKAREEQSKLTGQVQSSISEQALKLFPHLYAMKSMKPGSGTKFNAMFTEAKGPGWFAPKNKYTWGLFKYRCKLYGVEDPVAMEDTIDELEEEAMRWINANSGNPEIKLSEGQKFYWALKFGFDTRKDPETNAFWEQWFLRRFIPVFYLFITAADTVATQLHGKKVTRIKDITTMLDKDDVTAAAAIIEALDKYTTSLLMDMKELRPDTRSYKNWSQQKEIHGVDYDPYSTEALTAQANARREAEAKALADAEEQKKKETAAKANEAKQQSASTQTQGKDTSVDAVTAAVQAAQNAIGAGSQQGRLPEKTTTGTQQAAGQAQAQGASGTPGAKDAKEATSPKPTASSYTPKSGARVGDAVAQFESGNRGSAAIGWDRMGGTSYGKYQFAAKPGGFAEFIRFCSTRPEGKAFTERMISIIGPLPKNNSQDGGWGETGSKKGPAVDAWLAGVNAGELGDLEHSFMEMKMNKQLERIRGANPNAASMISGNPGLEEALWSTTVQHGNRTRGIFADTFKEGITPQEWATQIYANRSKRFGGSTPQVQASAKGRFGRELPIILGLMDKKKEEAASTGATDTGTDSGGAGGGSEDTAAKTAQDTSSTKQAAGQIENAGMGVGISQGTRTADLSGNKSFAPEGGAGGTNTSSTTNAAASVSPSSDSASGASGSKPSASLTADGTPAITDPAKLDEGLKKVKTQTGDINLQGLHPSMKKALAGANAEYMEKNNTALVVSSGKRTMEKQAELYRKLGPGKAARPNPNAPHIAGVAVDIKPNASALKAESQGILQKYGLSLPLKNGLGSTPPEPWHVELAGARKGGKITGDNLAALSKEDGAAEPTDAQLAKMEPKVTPEQEAKDIAQAAKDTGTPLPTSTQQAAEAAAPAATTEGTTDNTGASDTGATASTGDAAPAAETASATPPPTITPAAAPMAAAEGKEASYTPPVTVAGTAKQDVKSDPKMSEDTATASMQLEQLKLMTKLLTDISSNTSTMAGWGLPDALNGLGETITKASANSAASDAPVTQASAESSSKPKQEAPGRKPSYVTESGLKSRKPPVSNQLVNWA